MNQIDLYDLMEEDQHDPEIQYQMGLCYLYGYGTEINEQEALRWLQMAADQGHSNAMDLLGQAEETAFDEAITEETLPVWCMKAEEGDPDAQFAVANYFSQKDSKKYHSDITYYLESAAEQGHGEACLRLGKQLISTKDYEKAIIYLDRAAECSIAEAAELLSFCYFHGLGVAQNKETAEQFLLRHAEWGDGHAKLRMAVRYELGNGVPVSHARAMSYIALAQQAGLTDARDQFKAQVDAYHAEKAAEADRLLQEQRIREAQEWEAEQARLAQQAYKAKLEQEAEQARLAQQAYKAKQKKKRIIKMVLAACIIIFVTAVLSMIISTFKKRSVVYANFGQPASIYDEPCRNWPRGNFLLFDVENSDRKIAVFHDDVYHPEGVELNTYVPHSKKKGTVELTFSTPDPQSSAYLCNILRDSKGYGWNIQLLNRCILAKVSTGFKESVSVELNSSIPIAPNEWHTVALVDDGTTLSLYLNGVLQDSEVYCKKITSWLRKKHSFGDANDVQIGCQNGASSYGKFCGSMAEFCVYNYARSENQLLKTVERANALPALTNSFYTDNFLAKYEVARNQMGFWNGHYYKSLNAELSLEQAQAYCAVLGGHLATISSEAENAAIYQYIHGPFIDCKIYIGLIDQDGTGNWQWITGEPVEYWNWSSDAQSSAESDAHYAFLSDRFTNNTWASSPETGTLFLCEWDYAPSDEIVRAVSNPTANILDAISARAEYSADVFPTDTSGAEATIEWNGHTYGIFPENMTWEDAQIYCISVGGHLATISSQEENDMLYEFLTSHGYKNGYFGLTDRESEGNWKWVTGEPVAYTNWASGEPSNSNGEECYGMFYTKFSDGTWNDSIYDDGVILCEWDS